MTRHVLLLATVLASMAVAPSAMSKRALDPDGQDVSGRSSATLAMGGSNARQREIAVAAGGSRSAEILSESCRGRVDRVPNVRVNYTAGGNSLIFRATSAADTTLVINGPDGDWHCADDTDGMNPEVRFEQPAAGQYDVFVGSFSERARPVARLTVTEERQP